MSNVPLMPMATAVWLVENTTLTFKQISKFCNLHEVEVQGIADGEVAKGIMAYNPIISGQLTREEIELASKDENKELQIKNTDIEIFSEDKKIKKYIPLSKRQDKPDSALWLIKHHSLLKDSQIAKLVGITKASVTAIKNKSYWNYNNLNPKDPVAMNLFTQKDLVEAIEKAERRIKREKKLKEKELEKEIKRLCSIMHFPSQKIGKALGVKIESPFLNQNVAELANQIPINLKVKEENGKST